MDIIEKEVLHRILGVGTVISQEGKTLSVHFGSKNGQITRQDLEDVLANGDLVCYESQMLREWKAMAGIVQNGDRKGQPMHLSGVQTNSLCTLTTREPYTTE